MLPSSIFHVQQQQVLDGWYVGVTFSSRAAPAASHSTTKLFL